MFYFEDGNVPSCADIPYSGSTGVHSTVFSFNFPPPSSEASFHGGGEILRVMAQAACTIAHKEKLLSVCPDKACVLHVGIKHMERKMEVVTKLHDVMAGERNGGVLSSPSFGDFACVKCTKEIEGSYATWRSRCWELLPATFSVAKCWDEV